MLCAREVEFNWEPIDGASSYEIQIAPEQSFGYDASTGQAVVRFDGTVSTTGGTRVETRRFEATAPSDESSATIGAALNRALNLFGSIL